ncbi:N-acetyltransferase B complex non catalytic subunit-domain-containing protein [Xylaria telfairii]|nr:N-acetyltransferase B complex non catalytic subunit-domain-containing protein [Xylaria telfairii]
MSAAQSVDNTLRVRLPAGPRPVHLKHSVDINIDRAFQDEMWGVVANLARNRHRTTKDEYYKACLLESSSYLSVLASPICLLPVAYVVIGQCVAEHGRPFSRALEIAARSRSENPADWTGAVEAIKTMVDDNISPKDVDALDLYEFAAVNHTTNYAKSIGILRVRLTKALPKDRSAGLKCLEACMWHSDWENAQEIAASLNKNFPGDRKFLFYNILTTFLVATAHGTNAMKKKLFPNLAKAQADRAFNLRPLAGKEQTPLDLTDITEGEIEFWLHIRRELGSAEENLKLLSLPNWGPMFFLEHGFDRAFLQSMRVLATNEQWEEVRRITNIVLDNVIALGQRNPDERFSDFDASGINVSTEWTLWTSYIYAARKLPDAEEALTAFSYKLRKAMGVLTNFGCITSVTQKNYDMILLYSAFYRARAITNSSNAKSKDSVVHPLVKLAKTHFTSTASFDHLKGFMDVLNKVEVDEFVGAMGSEHTEDLEGMDMYDKLVLLALRLKIRFFQSTSLTSNEECSFCQSLTKEGPDCETCLKSITECALDAFRNGMPDPAVSQKVADGGEDPFRSLAILGSICLIKLAGAGHESWRHVKESPLYHTNIQLFLQAIVWLDFYSRKSPTDNQLRLLLVRLYVMMGSITQANELLKDCGIKNSLLETIGVVAIDRMASISPGHFVAEVNPTSTVADRWTYYFEVAIRKRYPDSVIKSLQAGNYGAVPQCIQLAQLLSGNCTLVVAWVENRRALRLKTGRSESTMGENELVQSLREYELKDRTVYDHLPQWAGPQSLSIQELTAYGPLPTNRRCQLSVLAEQFIDIMSHVHAKDLKGSAVDWQIVIEYCKVIQSDIETHMFTEGRREKDLTGAETYYFRTVGLLAKLVKLVLKHASSAASTKETKQDIIRTVDRILVVTGYHTQDFLALPKGIHAKMHTLHGVNALHAMGMLRDSALFIKYTAQYLSSALDRIKTTDKAHGAEEVAWLAPEIKKLAAAAAAADATMKERIQKLADGLNTTGWVDRILGWVFGENDETGEGFGDKIAAKMAPFIPMDSREVWAADVAGSWRDVISKWQNVKFD